MEPMIAPRRNTSDKNLTLLSQVDTTALHKGSFVRHDEEA
jgi:hypothetical protein